MCKPLPKGILKNKNPLAKGKAKQVKPGSSTDKKKKTLPKGKHTLPKGKHPLPKGSSKKVATKDKKNALNKKNLGKMGELSLKERIQMVTENADTQDEAAAELKKTLTQAEQQSAWGKMKTHLKNNPEEAKKVDNMSKKEVGLFATLCLLKDKAPKFMQAKQEMSQGTSLTKGEAWESELQMSQRFSQEEFEAHLNSGRVLWRNDPWTPGIFQYLDQGDIKKVSTVKHKDTWAWGQEYAAEGEDEEAWQKHFSRDLQTQMLQLEGKGKGKGSKGALTKGKGKGKKGKPAQLAIEDGTVGEEEGSDKEEDPKTEEEEWKECLKKTRKARDQCVQAASNLEEEIAKANKTGRLSKASKKDAEALVHEAHEFEGKFKEILLKKDKAMSLTKAKGLKDEKRELSVLANKTFSKTSKVSKASTKK